MIRPNSTKIDTMKGIAGLYVSYKIPPMVGPITPPMFAILQENPKLIPRFSTDNRLTKLLTSKAPVSAKPLSNRNIILNIQTSDTLTNQ